jgi:hypothetical protein
MFTLRSCFNERSERNNFLGNDYEIFHKSAIDDEFNYNFKELFPKPEENDKENVMAIVSNGDIMIPLYRSFTYYIMNESGKTFSKLYWK